MPNSLSYITHKLVLATVNQHNKIHVSNFTHCKDDCDQTAFGDVCYLQAYRYTTIKLCTKFDAFSFIHLEDIKEHITFKDRGKLGWLALLNVTGNIVIW